MKKKLLLLLPLVLTLGLGLASCKDKTPVEPDNHEEEVIPEPEIEYTVASAADAVAGLLSELLESTISARHDEDGDYVVVNLGTTAVETIEGAVENYLIPEGFEKEEGSNWQTAAFQDGTPVDYIDYYWNNIAIEYLVYNVSEYTGEEADYNGNYLQAVAFQNEE